MDARVQKLLRGSMELLTKATFYPVKKDIEQLTVWADRLQNEISSKRDEAKRTAADMNKMCAKYSWLDLQKLVIRVIEQLEEDDLGGAEKTNSELRETIKQFSEFISNPSFVEKLLER